MWLSCAPIRRGCWPRFLHKATLSPSTSGRSIDSLKFAKWLERLTIDQPHGVIFVMGGDVGLDQSVRQRADDVLSLSAMTLPHQLARVVLLEQIYRACTLMRNIPYHK